MNPSPSQNMNPSQALSSPSSIIDALQLSRYQLCRRRWMLERDWRYARWHPKALFDHWLRGSILDLSTGIPLEEVRSSAKSGYLSAAANPGLDLPPGSDPYQIASDYCAVLSTVLTALARITLLSLHKVPPAEIDAAAQLAWLPLSFADESGTLHRWLTVDTWDADAMARAVHSWLTVGDMAVLDAPMTLHVVEIGQIRSGRRHSPWARAFLHPVIAGRLRFQRPDGKGGWRSLHGDQWEPRWLADMPQYNVEQWVTLMESDGMVSKLLHHSAIAPLSPESRSLVLQQIRQEAQAMRTLQMAGDKWESLPMTRGACDGWRPCPHQQACYSPDPASVVTESGLYSIRAAASSASSEIRQAVASV